MLSITDREKLEVYMNSYCQLREILVSHISEGMHNDLYIKYLLNKMEILLLDIIIYCLQSSQAREWLIKEVDEQTGYITLLAETYFLVKIKQYLNLASNDDEKDFVNDYISKMLPDFEKILNKIGNRKKKGFFSLFFNDSTNIIKYEEKTIDNIKDLMADIYKNKASILFSLKEVINLTQLLNNFVDTFEDYFSAIQSLHDSLSYRIKKDENFENELDNSGLKAFSDTAKSLCIKSGINYEKLSEEIRGIYKENLEQLSEEEKKIISDLAINFGVEARSKEYIVRNLS